LDSTQNHTGVSAHFVFEKIAKPLANILTHHRPQDEYIWGGTTSIYRWIYIDRYIIHYSFDWVRFTVLEL
jgi:hypothetical protein